MERENLKINPGGFPAVAEENRRGFKSEIFEIEAFPEMPKTPYLKAGQN
jgi:hypothetical protein